MTKPDARVRLWLLLFVLTALMGVEPVSSLAAGAPSMPSASHNQRAWTLYSRLAGAAGAEAVTLSATRPFIFAVRDPANGVLRLVGRLVDPL